MAAARGAELRDVTVGIVGLGSIGRAVGALATAFGCRVVAVRRRGAGEGRARRPRATRTAAMSSARRCSTASAGRRRCRRSSPSPTSSSSPAPLTPETENMINEETLRAMKPGAWLINVARGRLVDERALLRALRDGPLGGAVLDTFRDEPLPPMSLVLRPAERHRHAAHRPGRAPASSTAASSCSATTWDGSPAASRCSTWSTPPRGTDRPCRSRSSASPGRARRPSSTR